MFLLSLLFYVNQYHMFSDTVVNFREQIPSVGLELPSSFVYL